MTRTQAMMAELEASGFQFLKDRDGWALYDVDDRTEVGGSRAIALGHAVWAAAGALGVELPAETAGE